MRQSFKSYPKKFKFNPQFNSDSSTAINEKISLIENENNTIENNLNFIPQKMEDFFIIDNFSEVREE